MTNPILRLATLFLSLLVAPWAVAHDPYEITTDTWIRASGLEITSTLARSTGLAILEQKQNLRTFDPSKFDEIRPRLEEAAKSFFRITSNGVPLAVEKVSVGLTIEEDLEIRLVYPRPAAGVLRFEAPHLPPLGYGYGNIVTVHGPKGELLGQTMLTEAETAMEVQAPAPPAAPSVNAPAAPAPAPATVASAAEAPSEETDGINWAALLVAILLVAAAMVFLQRRRAKQ